MKTISPSENILPCEECGLLVDVPPLEQGYTAKCPRCEHTLTKSTVSPYQAAIALAIAGLVSLGLSLYFPFMSFSVQGLSQEINLLQAAQMLGEYQNSLLGLLLFTTVVVLPALYLLIVSYLYLKAGYSTTRPLTSVEISFANRLCKILFSVQPWLMVEIFLIGVLVSLIKIASLAEISMGYSFWSFCLFTVLVVKCVSTVERVWLWEHFVPSTLPQGVTAGDQQSNHLVCHLCREINPAGAERCGRCHSKLHCFDPDTNLQKSWALLIASVIFYIPANIYPMMYTVSLGKAEGSTILEGVILLWKLGSYPIALVIFFASILIPLAKILSLGWLFHSVRKPQGAEGNLARLKLYRITEFIGRWSMIDIFVVAILVALVQLKSIMAIYPGPAALWFALVVISTMLSAMIFDPRNIWNNNSQVEQPN
ncbi:paraquat-inducible protein A [Grimontia hollisae]|uniref:paraquat-inducible protein A n=1 Tax=Grimontia hollisae TaxID=673 RepID=UPI001303CF20|nr:paraquat-inducible protein A [Grimontia hollisae]